MNFASFPFTLVRWSGLPATEAAGETGTSRAKIASMGNLRMRLIEYSPGYSADHWCDKGHAIFVVAGELTVSIKNGQFYPAQAGDSLYLGDGEASSHHIATTPGATLLILDAAST